MSTVVGKRIRVPITGRCHELWQIRYEVNSAVHWPLFFALCFTSLRPQLPLPNRYLHTKNNSSQFKQIESHPQSHHCQQEHDYWLGRPMKEPLRCNLYICRHFGKLHVSSSIELFLLLRLFIVEAPKALYEHLLSALLFDITYRHKCIFIVQLAQLSSTGSTGYPEEKTNLGGMRVC